MLHTPKKYPITSGGNSQILKHLSSRTTQTSLHSVKATCMTTSRTLISNCLLGICTTLVFILRAIFRLLKRLFLRMKRSLVCFHLALLHSTTFIFFLYHSPSSSSRFVVEVVSSNIDKVLILQPSANIKVFSDYNAHNTEWRCHSHTTDVAGLF